MVQHWLGLSKKIKEMGVSVRMRKSKCTKWVLVRCFWEDKMVLVLCEFRLDWTPPFLIY